MDLPRFLGKDNDEPNSDSLVKKRIAIVLVFPKLPFQS